MRTVWCGVLLCAVLISGCSLLDVIVIEERPDAVKAVKAIERKRPVEPEKAAQKEKAAARVQTASAKAVLELKPVLVKTRQEQQHDTSSLSQARAAVRAEGEANRVKQPPVPRQFTADYDRGAALRPVRQHNNKTAPAEEKEGTAGVFKDWVRTGMQLYTWLQ